jgi:hypothetical protein
MNKTPLLFCLTLFACQSDPRLEDVGPTVPRPVSMVYLHDVSGSYAFSPLPDSALLSPLIQSVAWTGGVFGFALVGTPDSTGGMIRQVFQPFPPPPTNGLLSAIIAYREDSIKVAMEQSKTIDTYIRKIQEHLLLNAGRSTQWTDANGALKLANSFFHEPGMENYSHLLYVNFDGEQDWESDHTLLPELVDNSITVWYSGGHKAKNIPSQWRQIADPGGLLMSLPHFTLK